MPPKNTDFVRVSLLVLKTYLTSLVGGCILADYKFKFKIGSLHHYAFNRLPNIRLMIVSEHMNGYNWIFAQFFRSRSLNAGDVRRIALIYSYRFPAQNFKSFFQGHLANLLSNVSAVFGNRSRMATATMRACSPIGLRRNAYARAKNVPNPRTA